MSTATATPPPIAHDFERHNLDIRVLEENGSAEIYLACPLTAFWKPMQSVTPLERALAEELIELLRSGGPRRG